MCPVITAGHVVAGERTKGSPVTGTLAMFAEIARNSDLRNLPTAKHCAILSVA
jgi:hypothetical protein